MNRNAARVGDIKQEPKPKTWGNFSVDGGSKDVQLKRCRIFVYCQVCGKYVICYFKYALYHGAAVCILLCNMYMES